MATDDVLTAETIREMCREFNKVCKHEQNKDGLFSSVMRGPLMGIRFIENDKLLDEEVYEEEFFLTFRQRWVEPMLHPVTMPFQPWVKSKVVKRTKMVPSRRLFKTSIGIMCHPVMRAEISRVLSVEGMA